MFDIPAAISSISNTVDDVIKRVIPDVNQAAQLSAQIQEALIANKGALEKAIADAAKAQADVNLAEAGSPSMFVSGWRPFIGWVCGVGVTYAFIAQPLIAWVSTAFSVAGPPTLDTGSLMTLLLGMLGLGGMRSYEKTQGVDRQNLSAPVVARKK